MIEWESDATSTEGGYDVDPVLDPDPDHHDVEAFAKPLRGWCAIRIECLRVALGTRLLEGIWGGLTAHERAQPSNRKPTSPTR